MKIRHMIPLIMLCVMLFPAPGVCEELAAFADSWNNDMNPMFEQANPDVIVRNSLEEEVQSSSPDLLEEIERVRELTPELDERLAGYMKAFIARL